MAQEGWIHLSRRLLECSLWQDKPFNRGAAWVDLLLLANHADKKIIIDGRLITICRGQRWTSYRTLADRWGWSLGKVKRFIDVLKSEQMVITEQTKNGTLLTVVNYDKYQSVRNTDGTPTEHSRNTDGTPTERNKNDKNDKNEKNDKNNNTVPLKRHIEPEVKETIDYLNHVCGTKYTTKSEENTKYISGRLHEGHTVDEFKIVIDYMYSRWHGTDRQKFVRPSTLFRPSHFEGYLSEANTLTNKQREGVYDDIGRSQLENARRLGIRGTQDELPF